MIIALTFILTSIFQYIFYFKNNRKEKKINDFLIPKIVISNYIFIYPFLFYLFFDKYNYMKVSFIFQVLIIGSIGTFFALLTYIFWNLEKRKSS
ncbi:MAG: hypothetical protein COZ16_01000 [Flavobacteriaceae bacterium CG_4_10_14_3_um_filter_31_253]|nr:MAG: hypothetical protein AUK46_07725 [Flavobacteriaceae bacterium CG2_30_31_66]PIV95768.1 MAG: hypothetical protein COW43_11560 [Flavobacteriaceae bacterium CG17_big_fil_post_rev_8_21_14_2_50_31_13]PIX13554.1 MAG: hypothetical protein COZ74_05755 [Flavobacteriaceae bacterium CG_4_8_14_3_um_filter_31_8]PIY16164.1 MAG: hypothetical protein COZ16_01000 [Flavobacteriaceae bacterium CG_4_10_14_3_um_filter_31_253]PIZ11283.1 MAG: hypothetical protein COY55_05210 [Flavobacteriaceae bacterium CG_4_1